MGGNFIVALLFNLNLNRYLQISERKMMDKFIIKDGCKIQFAPRNRQPLEWRDKELNFETLEKFVASEKFKEAKADLDDRFFCIESSLSPLHPAITVTKKW